MQETFRTFRAEVTPEVDGEREAIYHRGRGGREEGFKAESDAGRARGGIRMLVRRWGGWAQMTEGMFTAGDAEDAERG